MIINFIPLIRVNKAPLALSKLGDILIINNQSFDLSVIPDGATLNSAEEATGCWYFANKIERIDGELNLMLKLPIDPTDATYEQRFPNPIHVIEDGEVKLP